MSAPGISSQPEVGHPVIKHSFKFKLIISIKRNCNLLNICYGSHVVIGHNTGTLANFLLVLRLTAQFNTQPHTSTD